MFEPNLEQNNLLCKEKEEKVTPSGISHSFDTGIARACGVEAAIIYNHICFWIQHNIIHQKNQYDGHTWTYMTYEQMSLALPYFTIRQLKYAVNKLVDGGLLLKGDYSQDRFSRPVYYAIPNENVLKNTKKFCESTKLSSREDNAFVPTSVQNCTHEKTNLSSLLIGTDIKDTYDKKDNTPPIPQKGEPPDGGKPDKSGEKRKSFSSQAEEIGQEIIEIVQETKPDYKAPASLAQVFQAVDLMLRVDKREAEKIIRVCRWALADAFWADKFFKPNPAKYLREKFDQLDAKMNAKAPENPNRIDRRLRDSQGKPISDAMKDNLF
mgnify:CR=1 FL=1